MRTEDLVRTLGAPKLRWPGTPSGGRSGRKHRGGANDGDGAMYPEDSKRNPRDGVGCGRETMALELRGSVAAAARTVGV
jgi:hypothetical protein